MDGRHCRTLTALDQPGLDWDLLFVANRVTSWLELAMLFLSLEIPEPPKLLDLWLPMAFRCRLVPVGLTAVCSLPFRAA